MSRVSGRVLFTNIEITEDQLADTLEEMVVKGSRVRPYIKDGKVYNGDGYYPFDDRLVSENKDDVLIIQVAKLLRKRHNEKLYGRTGQ